MNNMKSEGGFSSKLEHKEKSSSERSEKLNAILDSFLEESDRLKNEPMDVAKAFVAERASPEEYENLIEKVEQACLSKIKLLERFQVFLRGDCLSDQEKQKIGKMPCVPSVRSIPRSIIDGGATDRAIFGSLLIQLGNRINLAYSKEYNAHEESKEHNEVLARGPVLVYGFGSISNEGYNEIKSRTQTGEEYFYGDTDDIGEVIPNLHSIDLPKTGVWGGENEVGSRYHSDSQREFFSTISYVHRLEDYGVSETLLPRMKERILRYTDDKNFARQGVGSLDCFLLLPKSHFHYALMAYRILSDIEALEKAGKE